MEDDHEPGETSDHVNPRSKLRKLDKVNSALPKVITMSQDKIRFATGFTKTASLIKKMKKVGKDTIHISRASRNPKMNPGKTASMKGVKSNKTPAADAEENSSKWHMDIVYGPCTAIGGITHGLFFVDCKTRRQMIFPLKNLSTSLEMGVERFLTQVGVKPGAIYTDFDPKLISSNVTVLT